MPATIIDQPTPETARTTIVALGLGARLAGAAGLTLLLAAAVWWAVQ